MILSCSKILKIIWVLHFQRIKVKTQGAVNNFQHKSEHKKIFITSQHLKISQVLDLEIFSIEKLRNFLSYVET